MQRGDRAVVHPEVRIAHHLGHESHPPRFFAASLGELGIDFQVELVAKEIRKDGVDRLAAQVLDTQEMMAELGCTTSWLYGGVVEWQLDILRDLEMLSVPFVMAFPWTAADAAAFLNLAKRKGFQRPYISFFFVDELK